MSVLFIIFNQMSEFIPQVAKKALSLIVIGKLFQGYRQTLTNLLIISNPFSLIAKHMLESVIKDVSKILPSIKVMIMNNYDLTPNQFRNRLMIAVNLFVMVLFMWKLIKYVNN